jgi:hypothetical protein
MNFKGSKEAAIYIEGVSSICVEKLRKTAENSSQDNRSNRTRDLLNTKHPS